MPKCHHVYDWWIGIHQKLFYIGRFIFDIIFFDVMGDNCLADLLNFLNKELLKRVSFDENEHSILEKAVNDEASGIREGSVHITAGEYFVRQNIYPFNSTLLKDEEKVFLKKILGQPVPELLQAFSISKISAKRQELLDFFRRVKTETIPLDGKLYLGAYKALFGDEDPYRERRDLEGGTGYIPSSFEKFKENVLRLEKNVMAYFDDELRCFYASKLMIKYFFLKRDTLKAYKLVGYPPGTDTNRKA